MTRTHFMTPIPRFLARACCFAAIVLLAACGTPMALTGKTKQLDVSQKSMVLASFALTRSDGRAMPWPKLVQVVDLGAPKGSRVQSFAVDTDGMAYGDDSRHYVALLRMSLAPGRYTLGGIGGQLSTFPLNGRWQIPLGLQFDVPAQSVVYLGRVSADMRPRKDTEFRAGSLIPLIDQALLGISSSTFDVTTTDMSAFDLPLFTEAFPALRGLQIKTQALPAFDRSVIDRAFMGIESTAPKPNTKPD